MEKYQMKNKPECATCHFFEKENSQKGECRLNPPEINANKLFDRGVFPIVNNDDWCGSHPEIASARISEFVSTLEADEKLPEFKEVTTSGGVKIEEQSEIADETSDKVLDENSDKDTSSSEITSPENGKVLDENSPKKSDEKSGKVLDENSQINLGEKSAQESPNANYETPVKVNPKYTKAPVAPKAPAAKSASKNKGKGKKTVPPRRTK